MNTCGANIYLNVACRRLQELRMYVHGIQNYRQSNAGEENCCLLNYLLFALGYEEKKLGE